MNKLIILLVSFLSIIFIGLCTHSSEKKAALKLTTQSGQYVLFLGEWVVEDLLYQGKMSDPNWDIEKPIGVRLYFEDDKILENDELAIENAEYVISILPKTDISFIQKMPNQEEMGIYGEYINFVDCIGHHTGNSIIQDYGFFVKDDDTLILFTMNSLFELKRLNHIPDYTSYYESY